MGGILYVFLKNKMKKNEEYYNKEAILYSKKRYPDLTIDFSQYLFKKRLNLLLDFISVLGRNKNREYRNILEIGCADGFILKRLASEFIFLKRLIGIDTSKNMIQTAIALNNNNKCEFHLRGEEIEKKFDLIIEVGVLNLVNIKKELDFVFEHLDDESYYICSLANINSLRSKFKFNYHNDGFEHLLSFVEYEDIIKEKFIIEKEKAYGLFIPYIWKIPIVARILQPIGEWLFNRLFEGVFHEKIYLLRKNSY